MTGDTSNTNDGSNGSKASSDNLQSMIYSNSDDKTCPKLSVLDQLLLPNTKTYIPVQDAETAWSVIRTMQIRGAPLIAIVALLGLAVDLYTNPRTIEELNNIMADTDESDDVGRTLVAFIQKKMEYLKGSRPTAVNLSNALEEVDQEMTKALKDYHADGSSSISVKDCLLKAVLDYAEFMLDRDVSDNRSIGKFGAQAIVETKRKNKVEDGGSDKVHLVTICNTGSLATAGYGTALGVARALQEQGLLASITACETRPYNQGSRLTSFEIVEEKMPGGQLICDSAVGALMQTHPIDAVVVGADRVCANGDTANKIGTYNLSIIAKYHNVPFFVAAPLTSCDTTLPTGKSIPIEERPGEELIATSNAPKEIKCWNPAFDVTPACNITGGIITECGIIEPVDGRIDVKSFVEKNSSNKGLKRKRED